MNIITIPLRNLKRKLLRSLMMALVFSIGVMSVVALNYLSTAVGESLEKKLTAYGANILLTPKSETLAVSYGGLNLGDVSYDVQLLKEQEAVSAIRSIGHKDRLSAVAPKLAIVDTIKSTPVGVIGVIWPEEISIKSYWAINGAIPDQPNQIIAGAEVAKKLNINNGDAINIKGRPFTVAAILGATGGEDDNVLFADLHALQQVAGQENQVHFIEVAALCAGCPIEDITSQLSKALPNAEVNALQKVIKQRMLTIGFVKQLALSVSLVILLTACVMIGLSIFTAVNERKKEIGVLRAMGFSRASVFCIFSLEALIIGVLAGAMGYLGGFGLCFELMGMLDLHAANLVFQPAHFALSLLAVALLVTIAAAFPAYKATRVEPSQALVML